MRMLDTSRSTVIYKDVIVMLDLVDLLCYKDVMQVMLDLVDLLCYKDVMQVMLWI